MNTNIETDARAAIQSNGKNHKQQGDYSLSPSYPSNEFKAAMREAGIEPPETILGDGILHRFTIDGKLDGAYILHLDGYPAGYFQDYKRNIKVTWKLAAGTIFKPFTPDERRKFAIDRQKQAQGRQIEAQAAHEDAAQKAAYIWSHSSPVTAYPYLLKKGVKAHGLRCYKGSLVVPLFNETGLISLQFIQEDGTKRMLKGGKVQGACCAFGDPIPGEPLLICEGWATGASLYEATGHFTVVAFSAGNLVTVARQIKNLYQTNLIFICGDNDASNVGNAAAQAAALAVGGTAILPDTVGLDWNDAILEGAYQ